MSGSSRVVNGSSQTGVIDIDPDPAPALPACSDRPRPRPIRPAPAKLVSEDDVVASEAVSGQIPAGGRTITIRVPSLSRRSRPAAAAVPARSRRRALLVTAGFVVLAVALLVTDLVLSSRASDRADIDAARVQAVAAADTRVPAMLSYSYTSLDKDLATAGAQTTGSFHSEYEKVLSTLVRPSATAKKITTKAVVTGSSVSQASEDHVVVLLFLTQSTSTATGGTPLVQGSRVNVTMTKKGKQWLVSSLDPV